MSQNFQFSHELLPKIPELKFYLSELFSNITPVPFDGADLNCAKGRLNIHELGENALSAKRLIFGPQHGVKGLAPCGFLRQSLRWGSQGNSPAFVKSDLRKYESLAENVPCHIPPKAYFTCRRQI